MLLCKQVMSAILHIGPQTCFELKNVMRSHILSHFAIDIHQ